MNKNENGFSLVIVVIFMSIAALFIGYLMGSYLISFLVDEDDAAEMAEQNQSTPAVSQQLPEDNNEEPEEINNSENNLTAPTEEESNIASEQAEENPTETAAVPEENQPEENEEAVETESTSQTEAVVRGGFGVQIGAFSNYNNALSVKETVSEMGYQIVITDSSPHQVQVVGYESRDEAESAAAELEAEGYPGFIVIRE